jgi:hypothetical protein
MILMLESALGVVFLTAALAKVVHRADLRPFLLQIGFGSAAAGFGSRVAPPAEGIIGILLLSGVLASAAAALGTLASLIFCLVLLRAYRRHVAESCRCFGALDVSQLSILPIVRAFVLAAGAAALTLGSMRAHSTAESAAFYQATGVRAVGVLAGVVYVATFSMLEQVWLFQQHRLRPSTRHMSAGT